MEPLMESGLFVRHICAHELFATGVGQHTACFTGRMDLTAQQGDNHRNDRNVRKPRTTLLLMLQVYIE